MSTAVQYWARAIASNTVVVGAFYLWQLESNVGAGNVFAFLMWTTIALRILILIGFAANRMPLERLSRPNGFSAYHWASEFTIICGMAWAGMFWCAGFYMCATLAVEGARARELSDSKAGAA